MRRYIYSFILCSQLLLVGVAQGEFRISFTKSINETFPEIKEVFRSLARDVDAPIRIMMSEKDLDSRKIAEQKNQLREKESIQAIVGHSSSFATFERDEDLIIYPSDPNPFFSHFIILRSKSMPSYLSQFNKHNIILYKKEYCIDLYLRLLETCYFDDHFHLPRNLAEDKQIDHSGLHSKAAILIKACGRNAVFPSDSYWQFRQETLATILPTIYFESDEKNNKKDKIGCLNEKSRSIKDDPHYKLKDLEIADIYHLLEKLELADQYSRDFRTIQVITREEKSQLVFLKKHQSSIGELFRYMRDKYSLLRDFYFEKKDAGTKKRLDAFSKALYLLSSTSNVDARSALADVYYREARSMHRAWDKSQGGVRKAVASLTKQGKILDDASLEKLKATIKAYDKYVSQRPKGRMADIHLLFSKNNHALLHRLAHYHYYNRGNCSENSLRIKDCEISDKHHKKFKKLKEEIVTIVEDRQNAHLKRHTWYENFKEIFESNFREFLPD